MLVNENFSHLSVKHQPSRLNYITKFTVAVEYAQC